MICSSLHWCQITYISYQSSGHWYLIWLSVLLFKKLWWLGHQMIRPRMDPKSTEHLLGVSKVGQMLFGEFFFQKSASKGESSVRTRLLMKGVTNESILAQNYLSKKFPIIPNNSTFFQLMVAIIDSKILGICEAHASLWRLHERLLPVHIPHILHLSQKKHSGKMWVCLEIWYIMVYSQWNSHFS